MNNEENMLLYFHNHNKQRTTERTYKQQKQRTYNPNTQGTNEQTYTNNHFNKINEQTIVQNNTRMRTNEYKGQWTNQLIRQLKSSKEQLKEKYHNNRRNQ